MVAGVLANPGNGGDCVELKMFDDTVKELQNEYGELSCIMRWE